MYDFYFKGDRMFNVLVVEDNVELRELFCVSLYNSGYNVIHASDGVEALEVMEHQYIDLIITDIMMPNLDGYELIERIKAMGYDIPILIVSAKSTIFDKEKAFQLEIDDYMVKPINVNEMIWRIEALLRRVKATKDKECSIGNTTLYYDSLIVRENNKEFSLPQKEFYLLYKLATSLGKIFTRQQLFDEIWGFDSETDLHTLDVHIARLRERFKNNMDFKIVTIRGLGYKVIKNENA